MRTTQDTINDINENGKLTAGKNSLIAHLSGKRLTQRKAIEAFCYECQGYAADGRPECEKAECPLHPYSQFNPGRSNRGE